MHVAAGLFSWSIVAELLALSRLPVCTYINRGPLFALYSLLYFSFLSKSVAGGECLPRREAPCIHLLTVVFFF